MDFLALAFLTIGALVSHTDADFLLAAAAYGADRGVFQYNASSNTWRTVLGGSLFTNDPIEITYDSTTSRVMWNDHSIQAVKANDLNGGGVTTVFSYASGVAQLVVDGMFMESQSRFLYYTEVKQGIVARTNLATGDHEVLWQDISSSPRDVIVDPDTRMMYWTVWGTSSINSVWQANSDGTGAIKLVPSLTWLTPNGFHYDKQEQALYVCDVFLGTPRRTEIMRIDLISNSVERLVTLSGSHCFDIEGNITHLFMSDWGVSGVLVLQKASLSSFSVMRAISSGRYYGLHYELTGAVTNTPTTTVTTRSTQGTSTTRSTQGTSTTRSTQDTSTTRTTAAPPSLSSRAHLSTPITAGIVVGGAALIAIVVAVVCCFLNRRSTPNNSRQVGQPVPTVTDQSPYIDPPVPTALYDPTYDRVYMVSPNSHPPPSYYQPTVPSRDGREAATSGDYTSLQKSNYESGYLKPLYK